MSNTVVVLFNDGTRKNFKNAKMYKHDATHCCFYITVESGCRIILPDCNVRLVGFKEDVDND